MPHLPGLDGLRGLAVIGVLLFHGGFTWAEGGFLGVSTFFTLSGFLITNLLVREFDGSKAIALGKFWVRRFRRLLPAALITIALVGLVWWRIGSPEQLGHLRGDMLAAIAYAANWRFYGAGTSYADLFSAPSPLQHFWSLAIEEQFYLFFPPIVLGVIKLGGRRLLTGLLVAATAVSVGLELWLGGNVDRVYYGTDTRAAELLLGALLAVWWSGRAVRGADAPAESRTGRRTTALADGVGVLALVAMFYAWHEISQTSTRLAHGGFPVYALGTTAIIYAATRPGLVTRALSWAPLRWAGLVSYGLYLYHWPIFLWIDQDRTGLSTAPLFVVRMAVTIAVAVLSYFLLEMPIRRGTMIRTGRAALSAGLAGALVVAGCAVVVTLDPPASQVPYANAKVGDVSIGQGQGDPGVTVPATGTTAQTVLILGDSGMVDATPALEAALNAAGTPKVMQGAAPGFGLSLDVPWRETWEGAVANDDPDLVIVMLGGWDAGYLADHGTDAYLAVIDDAVRILSARGAHILWLPVLPGGANDLSAVDEVIAQLPARYPGVVSTATVAGGLAGPDGDYPRSYVAPDGRTVLLRKTDDWHLCQAGAEQVATGILDALHSLGWSPLPQAAWQTGAWQSAHAYDDPPGVCDQG